MAISGEKPEQSNVTAKKYRQLEHVDWFRMRLVFAGKATLHEIDTHWDINEVWDMHQLLNVQQEVERQAIEKAKK